jgi:site-specific DNA-methyltransferase (adenine-specific)
MTIIDVPGCTFSPISLVIKPGLSFEHWRRLGDALRRTDRGLQFWIGDYFAYGATYGEASSQAANDWTGYEPHTLWNLTNVSEKVKSSRRREDLSWSHHAEVAGLTPSEQAEWLEKAAPIKEGDKPRLAVHVLRAEIKQAARRLQNQAAIAALPSDRCRLINCRIEDAAAHVEANSIDVIITDPPYPQEYLPLYEALARLAAHALKTGGSMLVMVGQSYLPEIINLMTPHLRYHWTTGYLAPGAHTQIWQRQVFSGWKPVLWFIKGEYQGDWKYDVLRSDAPDKEHHVWGQSESGMAEIVERFSSPGDLILDPFLGGGTTGVVAVKMDRAFVGIDCDEAALVTTQARLTEAAWQ